jgi:hypothetical protein
MVHISPKINGKEAKVKAFAPKFSKSETHFGLPGVGTQLE